MAWRILLLGAIAASAGIAHLLPVQASVKFALTGLLISILLRAASALILHFPTKAMTDTTRWNHAVEEVTADRQTKAERRQSMDTDRAGG